MAKPTLYTPELFEAICDRLSAGEPLEWICEGDGMPKPRTVREWVENFDDRRKAYALARTDGFDALAARALRLASKPILGDEDEYERIQKPRPKNAGDDYVPEFEMVLVKRRRADILHARRLEIDTILKLLAKWDPKRYGDMLALNHNGELSLRQLLSAVPVVPDATT